MTEIYIISGFLGAGKTTLIQKMLSEAFQGRKVMLIENDFGEASFDAMLLKKQGYQVRELNTGCICCSLTDDFAAALPAAIKDFRPEVLIIEPSGVGKLSKVEEACRSEKIMPYARVKKKVTVVDAVRCESYLKNFGEFFKDQVEHADTLVLSHTDGNPKNIRKASAVLCGLNSHADVISDDWDMLLTRKILEEKDGGRTEKSCACHGHPHDDACNCHGHEHSPDAGCGHPHTKALGFDTLMLRFKGEVGLPGIAALLSKLETGRYGKVLRAKGIIKSPDGPCFIQYLPGELHTGQTELCKNELCIIGRGLNQEGIRSLFRKID